MSEVVNYKDRDQELYLKWKASGSKEDLSALVRQLSSLIYSEVQRASGTLPTSALSAEGKKWAIQAIMSYDASKGASLSTYVVGYLQKVRRMNYKYQNMVRLPENLHLKYGEFNESINHLTEVLNRDPTDAEIAKHIGWTAPAVVKYKASLYRDLTESGNERASEHSQYNNQAVFMEHLRQELSRDELYILDHIETMKAADIARNLGVDLNRLNYVKKKLINKVQAMRTLSGMG